MRKYGAAGIARIGRTQGAGGARGGRTLLSVSAGGSLSVQRRYILCTLKLKHTH